MSNHGKRSLFFVFVVLTWKAWGLSPYQSTNRNSMKNCLVSVETSRRSVLTSATFVASLVALTSPTTTPPAFADGLPSQGATAPDFELPNSRGTGLTSLRALINTGKWTVLYFYPGAFTTGCTLEARSFQRDLDYYRTLNTQIVGVSVDPVEKNAQFCTEEQLDFILLSDKGGLVSKKYGSALSIPGFGTFSNRQTYIIDPEGELRWIFTDVESHIARHSSEVLDKLAELESVAAV
jgi:thioredoxin-dependent peroxiredoxin